MDSYHGVSGAYGTQGDVLTNGLVSLSSQATIAGDATALQFILSGNAQILGEQIVATGPVESLDVAMPSALENLGKISVKTNKTATIVGPGSFQVSEISVSSGGQLLIDNAAGPLTLYVTGKVSISGAGQISVADPDPEKFAIYVLGNSPVKLSGGGTFYGVIHAPQALVSLSGEGQFFGAFIGSQVTLSGSSQVHYDPALRGE